MAAVAVEVVAEGVEAAEVVAVAVGSAAARHRAGLLEAGGPLPSRLSAVGLRRPARPAGAVRRAITGRRSAHPAGRRLPEERPVPRRVVVGLRSNPGLARLLPPEPLAPELAWPSDQRLVPASEPERDR